MGWPRGNAVVWSVVGVVTAAALATAAAYAVSGKGGATTAHTAPVGVPGPTDTVSPSTTTGRLQAPADTPDDDPASRLPGESPSGSPSESRSPRVPATSSSSTPERTPTATGSSTTSKAPSCPDGNDGNDIPDPEVHDPSQLKRGAAPAYQVIRHAMAEDGITLSLTSGYRSYAHQKRLWEQEVKRCGSAQAARLRVLPPNESSHVTGVAIDIAPRAAQTWLESRGSRYGWCRRYQDETWHFEYSPSYRHGCPTLQPHP